MMTLQWVDWLVIVIGAIGVLVGLSDLAVQCSDRGLDRRAMMSFAWTWSVAIAVAFYWKFLAG